MPRIRLNLAVIFVLTWATAAAMAAGAADEVLTIRAATIGFADKFKAGFWQPARLTVVAGKDGARGRLELEVQDGDQVPAIYHDPSVGVIDLAPEQETTVRLYCKSGPIAAPIRVRLVTDEGPVWMGGVRPAAPAIRSTQRLVVNLGPSIGIEEAAATMRRRADSAVDTAHVSAASDLPDRWWAYDGVDTLVLSTSDATFHEAMTGEQRQAIVDWVLLGGRIVLCAGERGNEVGAPGSPWKALIPGDILEVDALRERSGLENSTKSELPFDEPSFQRNRPRVTRLKSLRGETLIEEASGSVGRPLVVHAPVGLGQVVFVGIDLDHPSLKGWKGRTRLVALLLQRTMNNEATEAETRAGIKQLGYDDLIGQLRSALDQFSGVSLVNFTTVSVLTMVYLLLIGPADWLLLSRLNVPRQVTWLTFPIVTVGMLAVSGMINQQVHGRRIRLNQAEVVDIDLDRQIARGTAWCHVYSPITRPYDLKFTVASASNVGSAAQGWLTWQGLPGDALGGLESRQPALIPHESYTIALPSGEPAASSVAIPIASSKSLSACWWSKTQLASAAGLKMDRYGMLAGEFTSPLAVPLSDSLLIHGDKLYRVGAVVPGQRVTMAELAPLDLEARLTQRRIEQTKDISTPWEQDSVDVPRIMQMLMFHEAARGSNYTGLTHRYQPQIDLSTHVRLGRAILVGRAREPVARLTASDGPLAAAEDTNIWTWYRILMPVAPLTTDK